MLLNHPICCQVLLMPQEQSRSDDADDVMFRLETIPSMRRKSRARHGIRWPRPSCAMRNCRSTTWAICSPRWRSNSMSAFSYASDVSIRPAILAVLLNFSTSDRIAVHRSKITRISNARRLQRRGCVVIRSSDLRRVYPRWPSGDSEKAVERSIGNAIPI